MNIVRKAGLFTAIFVLMIVGVFVLDSDFGQAQADQERSIPIEGWHNSFAPDENDNEGIPSPKVGGTCTTMMLEHPNVLVGWKHITVRDENDTIIAVKRLSGTYQPGLFEEGSLICVIDLDIDVPESRFYSVYLDDDLIATFADDEFPLGNEDTIILVFDQE